MYCVSYLPLGETDAASAYFPRSCEEMDPHIQAQISQEVTSLKLLPVFLQKYLW